VSGRVSLSLPVPVPVPLVLPPSELSDYMPNFGTLSERSEAHVLISPDASSCDLTKLVRVGRLTIDKCI